MTVAAFHVADTVPVNTMADVNGYGAGRSLQVTWSTVTTRTSSAADPDGGWLSSTALLADLGSLAGGDAGRVCFKAGIRWQGAGVTARRPGQRSFQAVRRVPHLCRIPGATAAISVRVWPASACHRWRELSEVTSGPSPEEINSVPETL